MTFTELKKLLEENFDIIRLADIAREFDVSPQVVNNWKGREQIPYKYIKILKEKIKEKKLNEQPSEKYQFINPFLETFRPNDNDEDDVSINVYIFIALKKAIENKFLIIITLTVFILYSFIHLRYFAVPVYESTATILPIYKNSGSAGGMSGIAKQFGIQGMGGGGKEITDLSSGNLVPEIINSRLLARSLLEYKFNTKKLGENKKLIAIMLRDTTSKQFSEYQIRRATSDVKKMISVNIKKSSPLLTLRAKGSEKLFIPEFLDAVILELKNIASTFKLSQLLEKKSFIYSRKNEVLSTLRKAEEDFKVFKETNRRIEQSPSLILDQQRLLREIQLQTELYITLKTQYEMAQIEEVGNATLIQVLDKPEIPLKKISPKKNQVYITAIIFSIIFCSIIIFIKEWYRINKKDVSELIQSQV